MRRRDFLKLTGLAPLVLRVLELGAQAIGAHWERVLILVELRGGNDGFNTVVPYRDEQYYRLRPQLAIPRQSVLQLSEQLGLNPAIEPLMPLWQGRELAIVLGVGYPNPNRSHFCSIEIWDTASNSDEVLQEGWIARLFAKQKPLLLSGKVRGGMYGQQPSLTNLAEGDLYHVVDYRSLYTTVARRWWGITGDFLQGRNFPVLDCLA